MNLVANFSYCLPKDPQQAFDTGHETKPNRAQQKRGQLGLGDPAACRSAERQRLGRPRGSDCHSRERATRRRERYRIGRQEAVRTQAPQENRGIV